MQDPWKRLPPLPPPSMPAWTRWHVGLFLLAVGAVTLLAGKVWLLFPDELDDEFPHLGRILAGAFLILCGVILLAAYRKEKED